MDARSPSNSGPDNQTHSSNSSISSTASSSSNAAAAANQLHVPSRHAPHQPPVASPLRVSVQSQHASSGSEEATPTQTPGIDSLNSSGNMASRAQAYLESWKDGAGSWSATPSGSAPGLPLHHAPQRLYDSQQQRSQHTSPAAEPRQSYFAMSPSDPSMLAASELQSQQLAGSSSRWMSSSTPPRPTPATSSDFDLRGVLTTESGFDTRKPSYGASTGITAAPVGGGGAAGGYASSVDNDFFSAPPSRLVSRTPTPVANATAVGGGIAIPRLPSPEAIGSTESDEDDSDYCRYGGPVPSGWSATLFGLGGQTATATRYSRSGAKHDYHALGTRRGAKWKEVEPDNASLAQDYASPRSKAKRSLKGYERNSSLSALNGDVAPDVRRRHRRRRQHADTVPTPIRIVSSLLSKTFRTFFGPIHPLTIMIALILIAGFVTSVTMLIIYILNPDKEPLPWRTYCQQQSAFPHAYADALAPVNVMVGVLTIDSKYERRNLIRNTYARHTLPKDANGHATANVQVKFILGKVRKAHAKRVALEMEAYNDIVVLDLDETQSARKTLSYFQWAAENATVPFLRPVGTAGEYNGSLANAYIASADAAGGLKSWEIDSRLSELDHGHADSAIKGQPATTATTTTTTNSNNADKERMLYQVGWKKVDYVVKADDDTFIVLEELERHLRVAPRKMTYWGYLVKNWFMGGEAYALSIDLIEWLAQSHEASRTAKGKEDTRTPQWLAVHPNRSSINWVSEHCWIYDHPKGNSPYSHGFLFPDYVEKIKLEARRGLSEQEIAYRGGERRMQSYSTVSKWHQKYVQPRHDMSVEEEVEALIEGGGRWDGAWVRGADGSTSETWVPYQDIVYESNDERLSPSATDAAGNVVLASDVGLEAYSGLPIYGSVGGGSSSSNGNSNAKVSSPPVAHNVHKLAGSASSAPHRRDLLADLASLPHRLVSTREKSSAHASDDRSAAALPPLVREAGRMLPRPTPKDSYGEWSALQAQRYLHRAHGGTVIVHYLKKTEYWLETALALSGKPKMWTNGAGGRGKEWRMGGSPLVRVDGYISEGRTAPRKGVLGAPGDDADDVADVVPVQVKVAATTSAASSSSAGSQQQPQTSSTASHLPGATSGQGSILATSTGSNRKHTVKNAPQGNTPFVR